MQNFTLACFGPIFFALHLSTSPTARSKNMNKEQRASTLAIASRHLRVLPFSVVLGYIIPSIVLGLPSPGVASYAGQQATIAVWTPFPAWVGLGQSVLTWADHRLFTSPPSTPTSASNVQSNHLKAIRPVYMFALIGSSLIHISTIAISLSTVLFPALFEAKYLSEFAPANLLFPRNGYVDAIGAGVLNFMQWDQWIGYTAVLIWALALLKGDEQVALKTLLLWGAETVVASILAGPGGAAVWMTWKRDEMALGGGDSADPPEKIY
jgi:hypothetical protein